MSFDIGDIVIIKYKERYIDSGTSAYIIIDKAVRSKASFGLHIDTYGNGYKPQEELHVHIGLCSLVDRDDKDYKLVTDIFRGVK